MKILEEKQENIVQNTPENSRIKSWKYRLRESARKYSGIKSKNERKYSKDYTQKAGKYDEVHVKTREQSGKVYATT